MSLSMYQASVPAFLQTLNNLSAILDKAEAYAGNRKIDPEVLLNYRLTPDMLPFVRQIQIAADLAKGAAARLADVEVPKHDDTEKTFSDLKARITLVSPGRPKMKVPWILMPSSWQSLVNRLATSTSSPFLMLCRIFWLPDSIADQQQAQAVLFQDFERLARHVRLGVARPHDVVLCELPGERFDARQIIGERIIVEEDLLDLRQLLLDPPHLVHDVGDRAHAIAMAADRLRPEAEGAAGFAAAPGVE